MTPEDLVQMLQVRADRVPGVLDQGREAAVRALSRVRVAGHMVYRDGDRIRVAGPRAQSVARDLVDRGERAAKTEIERAL